MNPKDHRPITLKEFEAAVKRVLLQRPSKTLYENRRPTRKELRKRWKWARD